MKYTKVEIAEMLKKSLSLKDDNSQLNFWLSKLDQMSEEELFKLADVLEFEKNEQNKVNESLKSRSIEINKKYLYDLKVFKGKTLPTMLKNMEEGIKQNENPDQILNDLNNA